MNFHGINLTNRVHSTWRALVSIAWALCNQISNNEDIITKHFLGVQWAGKCEVVVA